MCIVPRGGTFLSQLTIRRAPLAGAKTATERAHAIWKRKLSEFEPPPVDASVAEVRSPGLWNWAVWRETHGVVLLVISPPISVPSSRQPLRGPSGRRTPG